MGQWVEMPSDTSLLIVLGICATLIRCRLPKAPSTCCSQANPGPADYETNVSSFETKIQQTLTDVDIAFGSSDARYCLSETHTDYDAAPGDTHEDTDKMFGALGTQDRVRSRMFTYIHTHIYMYIWEYRIHIRYVRSGACTSALTTMHIVAGDKLDKNLRLGSKGVFGTTNSRFKVCNRRSGLLLLYTVFVSERDEIHRQSTHSPPLNLTQSHSLITAGDKSKWHQNY